MNKLHRIIISLIIVVGITMGASASMIVGVRGEKLYVIDYWQDDEMREHKLLVLNTSRKPIVLDVKIVTILANEMEYIDSGVFIESDTLAPAEYQILDYPGLEHWKRYLRFIVDGKIAGIIPVDMIDPTFDIPDGKIVTNCQSNGNHFRNLWLVLEDIVIPHRDKYTFTVIMECKKFSGPDYLLAAQSRTKISLKDQLVVHEYVDEVTKHNFDIMIEFPLYEYGKPLYREFDVIIEDPTYLPFVSGYYFRVLTGGNSGWYRLPLIFKLEL